MTEEDNSVQWPQVVISNMPKHYAKQEFESFLKDKAIPFRKVKKVPQKTFGFVTFNTEEEREHAMTEIEKHQFKNFLLSVSKRTSNLRENMIGSGKRGRNDDVSGSSKKPRPEVKSARDAVCPWWNVPYDEQLQRKTAAMLAECLGPIHREVQTLFAKHNKLRKKEGQSQSPLPDWINTPASTEDLPFALEVLPIVASPESEGYRNKCEFTFGHELCKAAATADGADPQMSEGAVAEYSPSLGFRVSSFKDGVLVDSPDECPNVPPEMKLVVRKFTDLIRQHPDLRVYDQHCHSGVWRLLTCRFSRRTNQMVIMLCVCLRGVEESKWADVERIMIDMLSPLACVNGSPFVRGVCLQVYDGLSVPAADHPVKVIFGEDFITERMNDCEFRVSPQAFFQVNTPCAEILYSMVVDALRSSVPGRSEAVVAAAAAGETTDKPQNLLCLDVCCGTGTIGICCAKAELGVVVGVELCQAAVDDAHLNAGLNDLQLLHRATNSAEESQVLAAATSGLAFVCARAEAVLGSILSDRPLASHGTSDRLRDVSILAKGKKVLAVVDPPREGLHIDCLRAIRNCSRIDRLVYVSCNPTKSLVRDCGTLCGPSSKKLFGAPFKPVQATPVDLFPMTHHCEMLLILERCT